MARPCSRSRTWAGRASRCTPVQQAMMDCHGSASAVSARPGFVMSLWQLWEATAGQEADQRAATWRCALGQPLPLHGLSPHPGCRRSAVLICRRRKLDRAPVEASACRAAGRRRGAADRAGLPRATQRWPNWLPCAKPNPMPACWPAAPMWACGSPSSSSDAGRSHLPRPAWPSWRAIETTTPMACGISAGASLEDSLGCAGRGTGPHLREVWPALRLAAHALRLARWVATWPMVHPLVTPRRC
jgi:hypothetical protein